MSESAYARARRDQKTADEVSSANPTGTCSVCHASTAVETLSLLGARCHRCYRRYVLELGPALPGPTLSKADKVAILQRCRSLASPNPAGRGWAYRLREREESGERLTQFQRDAWRKVLAHQEPVE